MKYELDKVKDITTIKSPITLNTFKILDIDGGTILVDEDNTIIKVWDDSEEFNRGIILAELPKMSKADTERARAYLTILDVVEDSGLDIFEEFTEFENYFGWLEWVFDNINVWEVELANINERTHNGILPYRDRVVEFIRTKGGKV